MSEWLEWNSEERLGFNCLIFVLFSLMLMMLLWLLFLWENLLEVWLCVNGGEGVAVVIVCRKFIVYCFDKKKEILERERLYEWKLHLAGYSGWLVFLTNKINCEIFGTCIVYKPILCSKQALIEKITLHTILMEACFLCNKCVTQLQLWTSRSRLMVEIV